MPDNPIPVPVTEQTAVQRSVLEWLRLYTDLPDGVRRIEYEFLPADREGMALTSVSGASKTRQFILGGYEAQYQFRVIYRTAPNSDTARLTVDDELNTLAAWVEAQTALPTLPEGYTARKMECTSLAAVQAVYEDGMMDSAVSFVFTYDKD